MRQMRLLPGLLLTSLLWPLAAGSEPSAELQARMNGHFRIAESEDAVQQRLDAAIEHAVAPMNFIARPIARSRLRNGVVFYCKQYQLALGAESLRTQCDDRRLIERRLDNSEGPIEGLQSGPTGVKVRTMGDDTVELVFTGPDGTRTTTYRFAERGALEVSAQVVSPSLERPVAWKIRYQRDGAGAASGS